MRRRARTIRALCRRSRAARCEGFQPRRRSSRLPRLRTRRIACASTNSLSVSDRERHARAPERELLRGEIGSEEFGLASNAAERAQLPAQPYTVRKKTGHPGAEVHRRQGGVHLESTEARYYVRVHEARAADEIRPKCIRGEMSRQCNDEVARERR